MTFRISYIEHKPPESLTLSFSIVDLEMAVAYWNLVLAGRFKFLDLWNRFLLVTLLYLTDIKMDFLSAMQQTNYIAGSFPLAVK